MQEYYLIHFGIGNVGKTLIEQLFANRENIKRDFVVDLKYCGMFGSKGGFFKQSGFTKKEVKDHQIGLSSPQITDTLTFLQGLPTDFLAKTIIIDTTTSSAMTVILSFVLKNGAYAVLSNKRPLAESSKEFKKLQKFGGTRFAYETTVGAGLPVIKMLKELMATGDEIVEISGCVSGTLGFICSALEKGIKFSQCVILAKEKGFTEYDPREDLCGMDVARKATILARMIGKDLEIEDLSVSALYPVSYNDYTVSEFMERIHELNEKYVKLFNDAKKKDMTLRYVANISQEKCTVGLQEVPKNSPFGNLNGPDNMFILKTRRYFENPIIIQGPGAGLEVTAAGVFGDILSLVAL